MQRRNEAKLSPERLAKLERFVWDALDAFWDEGFTHLQQYVAEHGHAKVPATHKFDGFRLGQWVGVQRKNKDQLSPERLAKLESRGFVWDVLGAAWDQGFAHLQQYVAEHGHTRVPATHKVDGFRLGQWVSTQRKNTDQLSAERVARLESLGFIWDPSGAAWDEGFAYLEQYVAEHGHARVLQRTVVEGYRLGGWVSNQRANKDQLSPERLAKLDSLGFIWDAKK